ncbi:fatty acid desaturase [Leucothrix pacifica]|uniref:Fatty acid desaturase n=1 Tax=Leucothrix pacifica TaxID=1247513 RepID=A0A317CAV4_9GAMM|nr:fatty acid desaturase [Leucothrix pacifica]PWQ95499.1 fatty acid desaturase [Leucothrix pacifica]
MNQRQFMASLTKQQRVYFAQKSDVEGLKRLLQQWLLIAVLMALVLLSQSLLLKLVFMLPLGILLVFQFTLLHETSHRTPFKSRHINDAVGNLCGFILLLPPEWFRLFHLEHHRHTNDPEKDPELASDKPQTHRQYLLHISGLTVWWGSAKSLWSNATNTIDEVYIPEGKSAGIQREARIYLALYVAAAIAILLGNTVLLSVWIVPVLLGQPFLRLYLLAEHAGCPHTSNLFENTRTTYTNKLVRWLAWNMPYHAEHHVYPAVPFYKLAEVHELSKQYLAVTSDGYMRFNRDYWKNTRQPHS